VINLRDKVKILDVLKGSMPLVEAGWYYGKKIPSIHSIVLNSMPQFFLNGSLLQPHTKDTKSVR
jgi:hypothetical protein